MIATLIWTVIALRGLWVWRHNAGQAQRNLDALRSSGRDDLAMLFVRAERVQDLLRAGVFTLYAVVGVISVLVLEHVLTDPTFLHIYGQSVQWVLVLGAAVFAINGEIAKYVQDRVLADR